MDGQLVNVTAEWSTLMKDIGRDLPAVTTQLRGLANILHAINSLFGHEDSGVDKIESGNSLSGSWAGWKKGFSAAAFRRQHNVNRRRQASS